MLKMKMQNRYIVVISWLIVLTILHSGHALRCYECVSKIGETCASEPEKTIGVNCSAIQTTANGFPIMLSILQFTKTSNQSLSPSPKKTETSIMPFSDHWSCATVVVVDKDNNKIVGRGCMNPRYNCSQQSNQYLSITIKSCTSCYTDLCNKNKINAAPFNTASLGWLLLLWLSAYILKNN